MIDLIDVKKTYKIKGDKHAQFSLNNINLSFSKDGLYFILGKSGSGKSTLLNLLGLLDKPDSGRILFDNVDICNFSNKEEDLYRNTDVAFLFQSLNLFEDDSVSQNIKIACELQGRKIYDDKISKILDKVGLKGFDNRKVHTLSGGEKQRVALARALAKEAKIILADEPTGSLDSPTGNHVFELLKKISKDRLVIVVTHDEEAAYNYGDNIIRISDGTIVECDCKNTKYSLSTSYTRQCKKSHVALGFLTRKSFQYIFKRRARLLATCIVSTIIFGSLGLSNCISSYNKNSVLANYLFEDKNQTHQLNKKIISNQITNFEDISTNYETFSNTDISSLSESTGLDFYFRPVDSKIQSPCLRSMCEPETALDTLLSTIMINFNENSFVALSENSTNIENNKIIGNFPKNEKDIMINDAFLECFKKWDFYDYYTGDFLLGNQLTAENIIGKHLGLTIGEENVYFVISGVLKTGIDFNYFRDGQNKNRTSKDQKINLEVAKILKEYSFNTLYFSESFFDNYKNKNFSFYSLNDGNLSTNSNENEYEVNYLSSDIDYENNVLFSNKLMDNQALVDVYTGARIVYDVIREKTGSVSIANFSLERSGAHENIVNASTIKDLFYYNDGLDFNLSSMPSLREIDLFSLPALYDFSLKKVDYVLNNYKDELINSTLLMIDDKNITYWIDKYNQEDETIKSKERIAYSITLLVLDALEGRYNFDNEISFCTFSNEYYEILKESRTFYQNKIRELFIKFYDDVNSNYDIANTIITVTSNDKTLNYYFGGVDLRYKGTVVSLNDISELVPELEYSCLYFNNIRNKEVANYIAGLHCDFNFNPSENDPLYPGIYFLITDSVGKSVDEIDHSLSYATNIGFVISVVLAIVLTIPLSQFIICSINDRKKEIGIFKSLGSSNLALFYLYYLETFALSAFIFIFGTVLSGIFCNISSSIVKDYFSVNVTAFSFSINQIFILFIFSLLISTISFLFALSKLLKCNPIEIINKD